MIFMTVSLMITTRTRASNLRWRFCGGSIVALSIKWFRKSVMKRLV
jgi:hypothetical protein